MVQMKGYRAHLRKFKIKLYIPHGSDERGIREKPKSKTRKSFISHMVQMKEDIKKFCKFVRYFFISHMVQMKGGIDLYPHNLNATFISHMVQMKASYPSVYPLLPPVLYIPHGSDERHRLKRQRHKTGQLYIPHGSDERIF